MALHFILVLASSSLVAADDFFDCDVGIVDAYRKVDAWMYGMGVGLILIAFVCTSFLTSKIEGSNDGTRCSIVSEAALKFLTDCNIVFLMILSLSQYYFGPTFEERCDSNFVFFSLLAFIGIYAVDLFLDFNALMWSRRYGIHAQDYESALFEGLERLHGYTLGLPWAVYSGSFVLIFNTSLGYIFEPGDASISGTEKLLLFVGLGCGVVGLVAALLWSNIYPMFYVPSIDPIKFCCNPCYAISLLCFRNTTDMPKYGRLWGAWFNGVSRVSLMMLGLSEAFIALAIEDPGISAPGFVLAATEFLRFLVSRFCRQPREEAFANDFEMANVDEINNH